MNIFLRADGGFSFFFLYKCLHWRNNDATLFLTCLLCCSCALAISATCESVSAFEGKKLETLMNSYIFIDNCLFSFLTMTTWWRERKFID